MFCSVYLHGLEPRDAQLGNVDGQPELVEHVEPVLERGHVDLARVVGAHSERTDGRVERAHPPHHVVERLGVCERERVEDVLQRETHTKRGGASILGKNRCVAYGEEWGCDM